MELFEEAFEKYLADYDKKDKNIELKYCHSHEVEKLMEMLATKLGLNEEEIRIAKVIGLLHDIGRFKQATNYKKMDDAKTKSDHGHDGVIYLFDEGHIRDFIKEDKYDSIIKDAIEYHNKLEIDKSVQGKNLLFTQMIRDMDKVDIFRVLVKYFKQELDIKEISKEVRKRIESKKPVQSKDIKTNSDYTLLYIGYIYDINFKETFEILKEKKYFQEYLNSIVTTNDSIEYLNKLKTDIEDVI